MSSNDNNDNNDNTPISTLSALQQLGLYIGVGDVYAAVMKTEDTATTAPVYETPFTAMEAVSVGLTPVVASGSQSASDRTIKKYDILRGMDVSIEYPRMLAAVRRLFLGRGADKNGGELVGDNVSPLVAVGICEHRDDGTSHMRWIYKCRFKEGSVSAKTAEEGQVAYRIPTLDGSGVALAYGYTPTGGKTVHLVQYEADTSDPNCRWTETTFFSAVCGPWSEQQPEAGGGQ